MNSNQNLSAEQARAKNIEAMGAELGSLYSSLWQELTSLYRKWGYFLQLFGAKQERVDLLNKTAPDFFRTVQDLMWADTLLHLARMTDSVKSAGRDNLTVRALPSLIAKENLGDELEQAVAFAVKTTEFARDWRNRRIAHRDLSLATGDRPAEPLASASRKDVESALNALGAALNLVSARFLSGSTTMFEFAADTNSGPAISMLLHLREGFEAEQARRARVRSGEFLQSDLNRRSI
jgi:hypothetical protein